MMMMMIMMMMMMMIMVTTTTIEIILEMVMIIRTMFTYDTALSSSGPLTVTQLYAPREPPLRDTRMQRTANENAVGLRKIYKKERGRERARTGLDTPLQAVSFPLQDPFARQTLTDDPLRMNPSSHWKYTLFGYVVSSP